MTFFEYLKDKTLLLLLQAACMGGSFFLLYACGMEKNECLLFYLAWLFVLSAWLFTEWRSRRNFFCEIERELEGLDKPYLISEVMPDSFRLEDKEYRRILRTSNKSVIDAIHGLETEQREYKEFIENWIHEVKLPLTAMHLICENHKTEETGKMKLQLARLENDVELALFYARSDTVYQDYMIRKIGLKACVLEAIGRNRQYLIQNDVGIAMECGEESIYCDDKWLVFILNQLLINAVKYKRESQSRIEISAARTAQEVSLTIEDNGMGIKSSEINRIFDKGFTGTNGRKTGQATGIGLYLCRKLCQKLGIRIEAQSKEGEYTRICLCFPEGSTYFAR